MKAYQLKIGLKHTSPPIWRRVLVPGNMNFYDLHRIIQTIYQWDGDHLFEFCSRQPEFYLTAADDDGRSWGIYDEKQSYPMDVVTLSLMFKYVDKLEYKYDFGAGWVHTISVEKEIDNYDSEHPAVIKYKGDNFDEYGLNDEEEDFFENSAEFIFNMERINEILKKTKYTFVDFHGESNKLRQIENELSEMEAKTEVEKAIKKIARDINKTIKKKANAQRELIKRKDMQILNAESGRPEDYYNINLDPLAPQDYNPFRLRDADEPAKSDSMKSDSIKDEKESEAINEAKPYFSVLPFALARHRVDKNSDYYFDTVFCTQEKYYPGRAKYGRNKLLACIFMRNKTDEEKIAEAVIDINEWEVANCKFFTKDDRVIGKSWAALYSALENKNDIMKRRNLCIDQMLRLEAAIPRISEIAGIREYEPGDLAVYSNVYRMYSIESIEFTHDNRKYEVVDMYCLNPECDCRKVHLVFTDPDRYGEEGDQFILDLDFDSKQYVIEENFTNRSKKEIRQIYNEMLDFMMGPSYAFHVFTERYHRIKKWASGKPENINFKRSNHIDQMSDYIYTEPLHNEETISLNRYGELKQQPIVNKTSKPGRNDPCPCGSGKKYKKCCGRTDISQTES